MWTAAVLCLLSCVGPASIAGLCFGVYHTHQQMQQPHRLSASGSCSFKHVVHTCDMHVGEQVAWVDTVFACLIPAKEHMNDH